MTLTFNSKKRGFTLIELLIVVAIIVALAAIGFVRYSRTQAKARDTERINNLHQISAALESYYQANGHFPTLALPSDNSIVLSGGDTVSDQIRNYIQIKKDPKSEPPYEYVFSLSLCAPVSNDERALCTDDVISDPNICAAQSINIPCDIQSEPAVFDKLEVTQTKSIWSTDQSWVVIPLSQPLTTQ